MKRDLWPRANPPIAEDEIASRAGNQLERDWIRAVSVVPNADPFPNGVVEGFKQSDVAVPTRAAAEKAAPSSWSPPFLQHQPCVSGPWV